MANSWSMVGNLRGPRGPAGIDGGGNGASADVEQKSEDFGLETIAETTFNGFRFDPQTGRLVVEQLDGSTPVSLPQDNFLRKDDYWNWVWTRRDLAFRWNDNNRSHLLMEVS
jgi:hypothetical protein